MAYRLRNHKNPELTLGLTADTWHKIMNLAERFGWNSFKNDGHDPLEALPPLAGTFNGRPLKLQEEVRGAEMDLVILEDALNLADALEMAFLDMEPPRLPSRYFIFNEWEGERELPPSIGAIQAVIEFCRRGTFQIESFRNGHQSNGG